MSGAGNVVLIVGIALLPLCSIQHFIWPLSWCLLADICNHTWIPECGYDELMDSYRIFIDECDMFEYNCDHETDYEVTNYSLCFGHVICPKPKPCPSRPTCPDHKYHRMGDRYVFINPRRQGRRMNDLGGSTLPMKMLKGKRRYTPEAQKRRQRNHTVHRTRRTTPKRTRPRGPATKHTWPKRKTPSEVTERTSENKTMKTTSLKAGVTKSEIQAVILKRETVIKNGKTLVKIVKGVFDKPGKPLKIFNEFESNEIKSDSDFIEK